MYPPTSQFSHPGPFSINLQLFKTQNSLASPTLLACFSSKVLGTLYSTTIFTTILAQNIFADSVMEVQGVGKALLFEILDIINSP